MTCRTDWHSRTHHSQPHGSGSRVSGPPCAAHASFRVRLARRIPPSRAEASALAGFINDEGSRHLWRAVSAVTSGERTVVLLYYRDGLPVRDIALALGVTTGTVKTLLFRARRRLRERLGAELTFDEGTPT